MKATELRIGNLLVDEKGRICKIDSISATEGFNAYAIKGSLTTHPLSPIPLTHEWIDKCVGLKRINNTVFSAILNPVYIIKHNEETKHWLVKATNGTKLTSVKDLHQLQNLYFALTGEELTIKELV